MPDLLPVGFSNLLTRACSSVTILEIIPILELIPCAWSSQRDSCAKLQMNNLQMQLRLQMQTSSLPPRIQS